ncbi:peroxidase [Echinicola sp. CAU 1574]|uniref:Peroxidase n=1 Tax=Echinicola arenosa TaxID=2774144 RepID=A0ABR9AKI8_9BACT|nr:peroxidase [Echinicola arenosa]MBD8489308.1 peroxidase [Echinicola arenosa]
MGTIHDGFTASNRIRQEGMDALKDVLEALQDDFKYAHPSFSPKKLETTHFITWVIIPKEVAPNGRTLPARLLLMTSYTGSKREHLRELAEVGLSGLHEVYKHCEEYHYSEKPSVENMLNFLRKSSIKNTFYTGFQYVTKDLVYKQNQLRYAIQEYLDSDVFRAGLEGLTPGQVRKRIQDHVRTIPDLSWALKPYKRSFGDFLNLYGALIFWLFILGGSLVLGILYPFFHHPLMLVGLIIFCAFIGLIGILLVLLRMDENIPYEPLEEVSDERIYDITSREIHPVKNEMSVISPLKRGFIRRFFLAFTLRIVPIVRAFSYIPTVHTARWLQTDGGRRLVFIAYYDNTSEGYAHDFVDSTKRTRNLNLIFGHASGFPATKWAVGGGGKDRKGYITGVRTHQKITGFWYSTFPELSVLNLENNKAIHKGLFGNLDEKEIKQWLLRL